MKKTRKSPIPPASVLVSVAVGAACISRIQGGGFPPGTGVAFVANTPIGGHNFSGSPFTTDASGNFDYRPASNTACVDILAKINGNATIQADGGGARAIYPYQGSLGSTWGGAQ